MTFLGGKPPLEETPSKTCQRGSLHPIPLKLCKGNGGMGGTGSCPPYRASPGISVKSKSRTLCGSGLFFCGSHNGKRGFNNVECFREKER